MRLAIALALAAVQNAPPAGSVSGRVLDADTGTPLIGVGVGSHELGWSLTDANGRYTISRLPNGRHKIWIQGEYIASAVAPPVTVSVEDGRAVSGVDFRIRLEGSVSGRVLDDRGEPVRGVGVVAISQQFGQAEPGGDPAVADSALSYGMTQAAETDAQGQYQIWRLRGGVAYRILAYVPRLYARPVSDAASDPKLRPMTAVATYYPAAESDTLATPVIVSSFEVRTGVDIRMRRAASYCLDATLTREGVPGRLPFALEDRDVSRVRPINVGIASRRTAGASGPDGRIRLCDLPPGAFQLTVLQSADRATADMAGLARTSVPIVIADADLTGVTATGRPPVSITGEVLFSGTPAEGVARPPVIGWTSPTTSILRPIPGSERFTFEAASGIPYGVIVSALPAPYYLKDLTYDAGAGEQSILNTTLLPGEGGTTGRLRLVVASDGGTIVTTARHPDGAPAINAMVLAWPAGARTEAAVAAGLVVGLSDERGEFRTAALQPGPYHVLATSDPPPYWIHLLMDTPVLIKSPETLALLLRASARSQPLAVPARAEARVTLSPIPLR